jgi:ribosome-interacting GTPase 1
METGQLTPWNYRAQLERELETVGIRLNQGRPNVAFKVKTGGGITINATVKLTKINEKMVQHILHDYSESIVNVTVVITT